MAFGMSGACSEWRDEFRSSVSSSFLPTETRFSGQGGGQAFSRETEWSWFGLEPDTSIRPDEIKPVGPTGVDLFHAGFNSVDQRGKRNVEFPHAGVRNLHALTEAGRILKKHIVLHVARHLPDVAGVRLNNVNDEERDSIPILGVQLVQRGNLPAKRRSRVTPKDQHDRLFPAERRKSHARGTI